MARVRPQVAYRAELLRALAGCAPRSILEVGCGGGGFLRGVQAIAGSPSPASGQPPALVVQGVDPDAAALAPLRAEGFDVHRARAEQLPFADGSFDAVVFCYTPHHVADWGAALREALRVSRDAVLVLDPWYDDGIPSQAVARAYDRWAKAIDRAGGMVHNDCLDAAALLAPLDPATRAGLSITVSYLLQLQLLAPESIHAMAEAQLAGATDRAAAQASLAPVLAAAARDGMSSDAAILLTLRRGA